MDEPSSLERLRAGRRLDVWLAIAFGAAGLTELARRFDLTRSPWVVCWVVLGAATVAVRRSHPVAAASALAVMVLAPDAQSLESTVVAALPSILAYSCGAHASRGRGLAAAALLAAAQQVAVGFSEFPNSEIYLATLGPWWVGTEVRRRRTLVLELEQRTAQLEAEQDAFAALAVRRERARIAHELHDIVTHHLAVIVVQAGAGRLAGSSGRALAAERFTHIGQAGREALADMARLIDIIDVHRIQGLGRVRTLLEEARAAGVRIAFDGLPGGAQLPSAVQDSAFRVIREGLTNAIKHAPGAEVAIRLNVRDDELEVEVRDAGAVGFPALAATGAGLGLTGMRERLESLGGELEAGPQRDGGWRLRAHLPLSSPLVPSR